MKSEVIQSMLDNSVLTHHADHLIAVSGNWKPLQAGED